MTKNTNMAAALEIINRMDPVGIDMDADNFRDDFFLLRSVLNNGPFPCEDKDQNAVALGKLGGTARAASLSKAQKQEIARKGAAKRWQDKAPSMSKAAIYQRNRRAKQKPEKNPAAVALGILGGLKGGRARAAKLSERKRHAIAVNAARARWKKTKD